MRKALLAVAAVLVLLFVLFFLAVGKNFVGLVPSADGVLVPGVQTVRDGYVNAFLIDLDDGVALVDCGNDPKAKAILAALEARSLKAEAVKAMRERRVPASAGPLVVALQDRTPKVRQEAAIALRVIAQDGDVPATLVVRRRWQDAWNDADIVLKVEDF